MEVNRNNHEGSSTKTSITRPLLVDGGDDDDNTNPKIEDTNKSNTITFTLVFTTFVAVLGSFTNGCALGYSSPAESGIMEDLGLSLAQYSIFGSIMTIGGMVGAVLSGKIADLIGRRRTMWLSQVFCIPGWLLIMFAKNAWWLYFGRLSIGFALGLLIYVVPVYVAEISYKTVRGRLVSTHEVMTTSSWALLYFVGNLMSWRSLALFAAIPCILQTVGLFFIPESPRWLAKCGREKEFEASLQQFRGIDVDISQEAFDIKEIAENFHKNSEEGPLALFQRRHAYPIFVGVGLMLLQQLGGETGISYYLSSVFRRAGFSTAIGTTGVTIVGIPMSFVPLFLVDKYGRTTLLLVSTIISSATLLLVAVGFYLQELHLLDEITPTFICICIWGHYAFFIIGLAGIPWVIMSEIFPMNIKATGGSLVTLTNMATSWLVTLTVNFMMEWSVIGTFCLFGTMYAVNALFVWNFVPETKGKTLEEIQASISQHPWSNNC